MKKIVRFFSLVLFVVVLSGCSWSEINRNIENSKQLRVGMTKEQVLQIMGEPLTKAAFHEENVWHYFVRINWYDGLYTRDECMPLVFKDNQLIGWGNEFKARLDNIAPMTKE